LNRNKVAVIINLKSGRGNGKGAALAQALSDNAAIDLVVTEHFEQIDTALFEFCKRGIETICISSGDGTIQHIQTLLAEKIKPVQLPKLCLLPHGTTNMTARDIGFRSRSLRRQIDFISNALPLNTVARSSLRISNTGDGAVRHGMFLGTGAISAATRYCQTKLNDRGVHGSFATGAVLALALAKSVFSKGAQESADNFNRPYEIALSVDGQEITKGPQLLTLCTTLKKLILDSRPFWGGESADIRSTSLAFPPPPILRWTWPMLYGKEQRCLPPQAQSASGKKAMLSSSTNYVLDGEFFEGPAQGSLAIEMGPLITYIVD
jgi:diacylglycerol kinase (ATP)